MTLNPTVLLWSTKQGDSENGNGEITISVKDDAPIGKCEASLTVDAGDVGSKNISIKADVVERSVLSVSPLSYDFKLVKQGNTPSKEFRVTNKGKGTLTWEVDDDFESDCFTVSPEPGSSQSGDGEITISVKEDAPYGSCENSVKVDAGDAGTKNISIKVNIKGPELYISRTSYDFGGTDQGDTPSEEFTVTNLGGGTLIWEVGNFSSDCFTVSPSPGRSQSGDGQIKITVNSDAKLGTCKDALQVQSEDGDSTSIIIEVDIVKPSGGGGGGGSSGGGGGSNPILPPIQSTTPTPVLNVSPPAHDFGNVHQGNTPSTEFTVTNGGNGTLTWQVSNFSSDCFTVSPSPGTSQSGNGSLTVTLKSDAPIGSCSNTLTVNGGSAGSKSISITVNVAEPPKLEVSPLSHDFGTITQRSTTSARFTVTNAGSGTLTWEVDSSFTSDCLTVSPSPGSSQSGAGDITVSVKSDVPIGSCSSSVTVNGGNAGTKSISIQVNVVQPTEPILDVSPLLHDFGTVSQGDTSSKKSTVTNIGVGTLTWQVDSSFTSDCFTVVPSPGIPQNGAGDITVSVKSDAPTRSCSDTLTLNAGSAGSQSISITVNVVQPTEPILGVSPLSHDFGTVTQGDTPSKKSTVTNAGSGTITWKVDDNFTSDCFTVSPSPGSSQSDAGDITVSVKSDAPTRSCSDSITVNAGSAGSQSISITVNVVAKTPEPILSVSPDSYDFGTVIQGYLTSARFTVTNGGSGTITWEVNDNFTSDCFTVSPSPGSSQNGNGELTVTVKSDATIRSCSDTLTVNAGSAGSKSISIKANVVQPPPVLDVLPLAHDFGNINQGSTTSTRFTVTNGGSGTITWEVDSSFTSDCFTVSPSPGSSQNGNGELTVTVKSDATIRSCSDTLTVNAGNAGTKNISIKANVVEPPVLNVSPLSHDFKLVEQGNTPSTRFTVTNAGGGTLTWKVDDNFTSDCFTVSPSPGSSQSGNGALTVTVKRDAPTRGCSDTLTLDAGNAGKQNIQLTAGIYVKVSQDTITKIADNLKSKLAQTTQDRSIDHNLNNNNQFFEVYNYQRGRTLSLTDDTSAKFDDINEEYTLNDEFQIYPRYNHNGNEAYLESSGRRSFYTGYIRRRVDSLNNRCGDDRDRDYDYDYQTRISLDNTSDRNYHTIEVTANGYSDNECPKYESNTFRYYFPLLKEFNYEREFTVSAYANRGDETTYIDISYGSCEILKLGVGSDFDGTPFSGDSITQDIKIKMLKNAQDEVEVYVDGSKQCIGHLTQDMDFKLYASSDDDISIARVKIQVKDSSEIIPKDKPYTNGLDYEQYYIDEDEDGSYNSREIDYTIRDYETYFSIDNDVDTSARDKHTTEDYSRVETFYYPLAVGERRKVYYSAAVYDGYDRNYFIIKGGGITIYSIYVDRDGEDGEISSYFYIERSKDQPSQISYYNKENKLLGTSSSSAGIAEIVVETKASSYDDDYGSNTSSADGDVWVRLSYPPNHYATTSVISTLRSDFVKSYHDYAVVVFDGDIPVQTDIDVVIKQQVAANRVVQDLISAPGNDVSIAPIAINDWHTIETLNIKQSFYLESIVLNQNSAGDTFANITDARLVLSDGTVISQIQLDGSNKFPFKVNLYDNYYIVQLQIYGRENSFTQEVHYDSGSDPVSPYINIVNSQGETINEKRIKYLEVRPLEYLVLDGVTLSKAVTPLPTHINGCNSLAHAPYTWLQDFN